MGTANECRPMASILGQKQNTLAPARSSSEQMEGFHPKAGLGKMGMFFKDEEALPRQIGSGRSIPLSGNRNKNAEKLGDEFLNGIITTHSNGKGLPTKSCGGYEQRYF
mmetsp:Transcript_32510/g.52682  ORF Transcript_32510/g.52682 Transcript_32510/m.52682 type:complete len:108 (+) Transcript_32510:1190-1513(+)